MRILSVGMDVDIPYDQVIVKIMSNGPGECKLVFESVHGNPVYVCPEKFTRSEAKNLIRFIMASYGYGRKAFYLGDGISALRGGQDVD